MRACCKKKVEKVLKMLAFKIQDCGCKYCSQVMFLKNKLEKEGKKSNVIIVEQSYQIVKEKLLNVLNVVKNMKIQKSKSPHHKQIMNIHFIQ